MFDDHGGGRDFRQKTDHVLGREDSSVDSDSESCVEVIGDDEVTETIEVGKNLFATGSARSVVSDARSAAATS